RVKERHSARFSPAALERITLNTDKVRQEGIIFVAGDVHIELCPNATLLPLISIPELETWVETWSFSETIHSRSYTHIIRGMVD
ncbi:hypothetical protein QUG45_25870, partial [Enterobacter hormaechei]|nr:hypothetical protein [Enterobacter hormaechei]